MLVVLLAKPLKLRLGPLRLCSLILRCVVFRSPAWPALIVYLQLQPDVPEAAPTAIPSPEDARMTSEQLKELCDAMIILSSKSSVLKERDELRALMEENLQAEEVRNHSASVDAFSWLTTARL